MNGRKPHPDQLSILYGQSESPQPLHPPLTTFEAEREAVRWRARLVLIESVMMAALMLGAGLAMNHGFRTALQNAVLVGIACLLTGMLLIGLSALASRLLMRLSRRRQALRKDRSDKL
ncbi:hypothetical protein [Novosphingobium sp. SG707]|uniref:hypothetical protein n=1 Tax=Novosphingobium sp. SG707 TaxID=2586996 RepID=UPI0014459AC1|nr:hypothetical protein [Novosphingobium sp. SG707]NKJ00359.1 hypothetical protein [Novosphingobium sp. SG707]